jgi:hypothetical protein
VAPPAKPSPHDSFVSPKANVLRQGRKKLIPAALGGGSGGGGGGVVTRKDRRQSDQSSRKKGKDTKALSDKEEESEFEDYDSEEDSDFIPEDRRQTDKVEVQSLMDIIRIQKQQLESFKVNYFNICRH